MSKIIKNTSVSGIELRSVGQFIPGGGQIEIHQQDYLLWSIGDLIDEIIPFVSGGDLVVNDGIQDLSSVSGIDYNRAIDFLRYPDTAFNTRFLSEPERNNGFISKTVQEAVEEGRNSAIGTLVPFEFVVNGNVSNKWLGYANSAASSQLIPLIAPQDVELKGITFSNLDDDVDIDIECYINDILEFTWEIRNKRYAHKSGITTPVLAKQGDRFSVFLKRFNGGTGDPTPQDPIVTLYVKFMSEQDGENGSQTGM